MSLLVYLAPLLIAQLSTGQILSLGRQNGQIGIPALQNFHQKAINVPSNNIVLQNNGVNGLGHLNSGIGNVNNVQVVKNLPVAGIVTNNNANNLITSNLNNNLIATNIGNSFGNNLVSTNLVSNVGMVNNGANWVNANVPVNLANGFNINTGTFALGNTGLSRILPAGIPCGIQILADALEVGGAVGVTGQLPFYTTVSVSGVLPSSGSGVIGCGCGQ